MTDKKLKSQPIAFLDTDGSVIVVGIEAFKKVSFVDADRAFPFSWKELVIKKRKKL